MRWSLLIGFCLCVLSFFVGFFFGGASWLRMGVGSANDIAFWSMVGGWVSGIATFAAVIVSLWMAYQASQSSVEKIQLTTSSLKKKYGFGDPILLEIYVKNMKPVVTPLEKLLIQVDDAVADLAPVRIRGTPLPYTLHQQGEQWQFDLEIRPMIGWTSILEIMSREKPLKFKTGYFIVETAMKQHRVKMTQEILEKIIQVHQKDEALKKTL